MLDLSLAEIGFIVLVAVIFLGPKEIPVVARTLTHWLREVKQFVHELTATFRSAVNESGLLEDKDAIARELESDMRYIRDMEGQLRRVYDISNIMEEERQKRAVSQAPAGEETHPDASDASPPPTKTEVPRD